MNETTKQDLEGQIREKEAAVERQAATLARYEQAIGRDRWFNRGCHELHTLRMELESLKGQLETIMATASR